MFPVTQRIKYIKQPPGGYIKLEEFTAINQSDSTDLKETENIHASLQFYLIIMRISN